MRLILGSVAFLASLFSFSMAYISLTPGWYQIRTQLNNTMATQTMPAWIDQTWARILSIYSYSWTLWGTLGVVFMVIWLFAWIQKEDRYTIGGGVR